MAWRCAAIFAVLGWLFVSTPRGQREFVFTPSHRVAINPSAPSMASIGGLTFTTAFGPATSVASVRDIDVKPNPLEGFAPEVVAAFDFSSSDDGDLSDVAAVILSDEAQATGSGLSIPLRVANPMMIYMSANAGNSLNDVLFSESGLLGDDTSEWVPTITRLARLSVASIPSSGPTPPLTPSPTGPSIFGQQPAAAPLPTAFKQGVLACLFLGVVALKRRSLIAALRSA